MPVYNLDIKDGNIAINNNKVLMTLGELSTEVLLQRNKLSAYYGGK